MCLFQLNAEFRRIVTTDLLESFLGGLDALVPNVLELYKAAVASNSRPTLSSILQCLGKEVCSVNKPVLLLLTKICILAYILHSVVTMHVECRITLHN